MVEDKDFMLEVLSDNGIQYDNDCVAEELLQALWEDQ